MRVTIRADLCDDREGGAEADVEIEVEIEMSFDGREIVAMTVESVAVFKNYEGTIPPATLHALATEHIDTMFNQIAERSGLEG